MIDADFRAPGPDRGQIGQPVVDLLIAKGHVVVEADIGRIHEVDAEVTFLQLVMGVLGGLGSHEILLFPMQLACCNQYTPLDKLHDQE